MRTIRFSAALVLVGIAALVADIFLPGTVLCVVAAGIVVP